LPLENPSNCCELIQAGLSERTQIAGTVAEVPNLGGKDAWIISGQQEGNRIAKATPLYWVVPPI